MMTTTNKKLFLTTGLLLTLLFCYAEDKSVFGYTSTNNNYWQFTSLRLSDDITGAPDIILNLDDEQQVFNGWGTCFNELGWDALRMLKQSEQEDILFRLYAPKGDLRYDIGRIPVGANDYARSWYSSNEVDGDFEMNNFNIDRDKQVLIPYIKQALSYNPAMTFWASPWSPPSWMKTNKHYANKSGDNNGLALKGEIPLYQDQFNMQPQYMQAYALYFSKFIDAYRSEGITISKLMYQNEAYSFNTYPTCSWSIAGSLLFNSKYLGPYFAVNQPTVQLYLGTMNTNNIAVYETILSNSEIAKYIKGVGFQWEGLQVLPTVRRRYPLYHPVQSESECGWGSFDWGAAVHTNNLMFKYLVNGCEEYTFWNAILKDKGVSTWGWVQNSLIRVNSKDSTYQFTPEYYAVKHNTHFIARGSVRLSTSNTENNILAFRRPDRSIVISMSNQSSKSKTINLKVGAKYLTVTMPASSFNTYVIADPFVALSTLVDESSSVASSKFLNNALAYAKTLDASSDEQVVLAAVDILKNLMVSASESQLLQNQFQSLIRKAKSLSVAYATNKTEFEAAILHSDSILSDSISTKLDYEKGFISLSQAINTFQWNQNIGSGQTVDYSFWMLNPSFHSGSTHDPTQGNSVGWSSLNQTTGSGDFRLNYLGGRNCWNSWSNNFSTMNFFQDVENLPPGLYSISCSAMTTAGSLTNQHAYLSSGLQTVISPNMTLDKNWNTAQGWEKLTTAKVVVGKNGKLRIGFTSISPGNTTSGWFCVTDFQLTYHGKGEAEFNTILQNKLSMAATNRLLAMLKGDLTKLDSAIAAGNRATSIDEKSHAIEQLTSAIVQAKLSNAKWTQYYTVTKTKALDYLANQLQSSTSKMLYQRLIDQQQTVLANDTTTHNALNEMDAVLTSAQSYIASNESALDFSNAPLFSSKNVQLFKTFLTELNNQFLQSVSSFHVEALSKELAEATRQFRLTQAPSDSTNFSFVIKSADGGSAANNVLPEGWSGILNYGTWFTNAGLHYSGNTTNRYFDAYNGTKGLLAFTADQHLKDIPNGTFKLRCAGRADGLGSSIFAKADNIFYKKEIDKLGYEGGQVWSTAKVGSAERNANTGKGYGWSWYEIKDIKVSDNQLTIGFSNEPFMTGTTWAGTWFSLDDFQLFYTESVLSSTKQQPRSLDKPTILCLDRKIQVTPSVPYSIYSITGTQVRSNANLQNGIYLVRIGDDVTKVCLQ